MAITLAELARRYQGQVRGDPGLEIHGVAALEAAGAGEIAFVADNAHAALGASSPAGALILSPADAEKFAGNALIVENPRLCFARVAALLHPPPAVEAGIHPTAAVDAKAEIAGSACIGPHAVVEAGAAVKAGCYIGPGSYIGRNAVIGENTRLHAQVAVHAECVIGGECIVHVGAVIGSDGFGYASDGPRWVKIPQLGRVLIGNHVEIGANTCIDRGALGDTVIEDGVKLDNLVHIAHNVRIGENTAMAACVGIAGSTRIGRRCTLGGQAGVIGHLEIADDVHITATSLVTSSITVPGVYSSALKAHAADDWRKNAARLQHLDEMARRLKGLERKIQRLTKEKKS